MAPVLVVFFVFFAAAGVALLRRPRGVAALQAAS